MQNQMGGMGGKGGQQPQGGFRGKGGAQQTQGGFGGKGAGRFQPQQPQQPPQGGFSGKGGQQQNPYAQQYYQPQFQPEYFNNPYAQGGFGQQPQMGGFGGKGGQMPSLSQDLPNSRPDLMRNYPQQGGQSGIGDFERSQFQQGGMGGKGGPMSGYRQQLQQRRMADMLRGVPQQSGLAALAQPTATTQAASPAPEQPYMGNYMS
jgi:hypothetical protein